MCLSRLADSVLNGAKKTEFENKDVKDGHLHVTGGNTDVTLFLIYCTLCRLSQLYLHNVVIFLQLA